jgi:sugar-specific transcriptional regulator TrmB
MDLLRNLGLTENESKVYEMLLSEGESLAGTITRRTGIHRRNVYDCLERLVQKGLVGYIKENNQRLYRVTDPRGLQEQLTKQQNELQRLLPAMIAKYEAKAENKETLFFRGKAGIRQVLNDQLRFQDEILVHATSVSVGGVLRAFFPAYQRERADKRIRTRMLFDDRFREQAHDIQKLALCDVRFVQGVNRGPVSQYIYGDNVAIVVWSDAPVAILIRQKEISQGFRDQFEALWKSGKK